MSEFTVGEYAKALASANLLKAAIHVDEVASVPVQLCTFDSRAALPGTLFVCKGAGFKENYLSDAIKRGVVCYVSEVEYKDRGPALIVSDIRMTQAVLANMFYCEPFRHFPLIGLTGTKGKSTTLYFLRSIIERYNAANGLGGLGFLSTIDTYDGVEAFESHLTTPEALVLAKHFDNVRQSGLWGMVMEVSSQALKYHRTYGVEFTIGCFLNYGSDHIGELEHPDEEDYISSKLKFFDQCHTICLNMDTDKLPRILEAAEKSALSHRLVTYSSSGRTSVAGVTVDYTATDVRKIGLSTAFNVNKRMGDGASCESYEALGEIQLSLPGLFNVENALAACVICMELGIPFAAVQEGLYDAKADGRMEVFTDEERHVVAIVDYAHNSLSFDKLFSSTKEEYPGYRIEAVFGCPGGKGVQRRTELPQVVSKYADYVYVTEEDPAEESAEHISQIVLSNLKANSVAGEIILDRVSAIETAIKKAPPKTVIVITGKGRELYMHRGTAYEPIESDVSIVQRFLKG